METFLQDLSGNRLPFAIENPPDWLHWLAQDPDGVWWGFEVEPLQHDHGMKMK